MVWGYKIFLGRSSEAARTSAFPKHARVKQLGNEGKFQTELILRRSLRMTDCYLETLSQGDGLWFRIQNGAAFLERISKAFRRGTLPALGQRRLPFGSRGVSLGFADLAHALAALCARRGGDLGRQLCRERGGCWSAASRRRRSFSWIFSLARW